MLAVDYSCAVIESLQTVQKMRYKKANALSDILFSHIFFHTQSILQPRRKLLGTVLGVQSQ